MSRDNLKVMLEATEQHAERGWNEAHEQEARAEAAECRIASLEAERDQLAAECAALKLKSREVLKEAAYVYSHYNRMVEHLEGESIDEQTLHELQELIEAQTPATDRFIAEQRAIGAELCVKALVTSDDDDFVDAPNICANVAAQLRNEVKV